MLSLIHILNGAFAGDEVSLLMSEENSYHSFYVVEVIHAKQKNRIFEKRKGKWVSLENNFYKAVLDEKDVFLDGTKILATYRYNKKTESFHITCLKVVAENLEDWIIEYASQYGFSRQFSKESLAECSSLKKVQLDKDRVDLRKLKVISIDPVSYTHLSPVENGITTLYDAILANEYQTTDIQVAIDKINQKQQSVFSLSNRINNE